MIGKTVSHYRVSRQIGHGGMGEVYLADDLILNRKVALKVLPEVFRSDPDRKGRFEREARLLAALNHPNIVTIYDIGQTDDATYIVMEYVAGKTLYELIPHKGMRLPVVLKHAVQIAGALARAHGAGVIHRDLKPSNVMVDEHEQVKVLDFGLAKRAEVVGTEAETATTLTAPYTVLGTVAYMSPEQAEGGHIDARSDIFSFGSLLYEMLTGQRAFAGDTRASTIALILREDPKPLSHVVEGVPRDVERLVRRCLRKDPEQRYQTMADLKVALEDLKEDLDSGAVEGAAAVGKRRRRWWPWAAGVAAALLLAGLIWLPREGTSPAGLTPVPLIATGNSCCPTFSPDGTKVAFSWTGDQDANAEAAAGKAHWEIYVKQIGAPGNPARLTTTPAGIRFGAIDSAWSPDDRWIAYRRSRTDEGSDLVVIPPLGGPERTVADLSGTVEVPAWTPDGKWLAFPQKESPITSSIWAIAIDTGERRRLTTFTTNAGGSGFSTGVYDRILGDSAPSFSPDGGSVAFWRQVSDSVFQLCVQSLTRDLRPDGEAKIVANRIHGEPDGGPVWTPDGRELIYSAGYPNFLWRVAASGWQAPRKLPYPAATLQPAMASRRLVYPWYINNTNLWRLDVRTGVRKPLISSASSVWGKNIHPQFSPDGRKIAFDSDRTGDREVWICDADGENCQQLTKFGGPIGGNPRWSPDSRWIALDSRASGNPEIYVIAADGGAPRRLTTSPYNNMIPSWSRDGRWIYFASDRSGRYEVWKMSRDGGEAIQVTHAGGFVTFESPDGKYLYYTKLNQEGTTPLFRMPAGGGEEVVVVPAVGSWEFLCVTSKGVYFVPEERGARTIRFLDAASGKVRTLATPDQPLEAGLAVSPDDASVVWSQRDRETYNLMLVEGFR